MVTESFTTGCQDRSGGDIAVLFLEQPQPLIDVTAGDLEQAGGAAGAALADAVALRQREAIALLPAHRLVADLAFPGALPHAAHRGGVGAERKRGSPGIELHQEAV